MTLLEFIDRHPWWSFAARRLRDDSTSTETRAAMLLDLALQQVAG